MSAASAAMNITHKVALAKITPPRQPSTAIDRDGAFGALEQCLSRKIVIVEGPAGSAKTGLLAEAHRRFGARPDKWRCAWLSVDGSDDRQRLSRHVAAALKTIWADIGLQTLEELYDGGERQFTIALSNYLLGPAAAGSTDYVLFVDDLHHADADAVAEFLNAVAEYFPDNVHVVASGNYELWDNLDLRFRDSVSAFPSEKLAFTCAERARAMLSSTRNIDMLFESAGSKAHYQAAAGLGAQAFRLTTKTVLQIAGKSVPRNVDLLVYLTHARVALSMGYLSEAREAVRLLRGAANAGDAVFQLAADDVEAAIDDADGWKGNSADLLAPIERAVEANLGWYELRLCIRMAVRLSHEGSRTEALAYLNRALRLQAGQHIVGPFLAAGAPIRSLLHEAVDFRKSGGQARLLAKAVLRES